MIFHALLFALINTLSSVNILPESPSMAESAAAVSTTHVITVTFGKSFPYSSPTSNEPLRWGGRLQLEGGALAWIDKLLDGQPLPSSKDTATIGADTMERISSLRTDGRSSSMIRPPV